MEEKIVTVLNEMAEYLSVLQMKKLQEVMLETFSEGTLEKKDIANEEYLKMFLDAKKIEGCSERTIQYYGVTIEKLLSEIVDPVRKITTERIRKYLSDYQQINSCSKVTVDNVRRNISSFFSWLEEENYILKSPMKRIHKIKANQQVKEVISDEDIEKLRDNCKCKRDLAMIDLLYSTGIRVGELVNLDITDLDLQRIFPHKFRRLAATRAIDKGMPIEQVQRLLGHSQIDTTMQYAIVNQNNVKTSHQKYLS